MVLVLLTGLTTSAAHAGTGVVPASTSWTSADRGWVLGLDTLCQTANCPQLVRTTDGGTTWTRVRTPALTVPGAGRLRVVFASDTTGMVTDGEQLFVTNDGGTRWTSSGVKGTVGALGFDNAAFLAVIHDGTASRLYQRELWSGSWQPVPGVEVKGAASGSIAAGHVSLSVPFQENRYWTRGLVSWREEVPPCTAESATRLGTAGGDRYALCSFDPGFGNMTKELRKATPGGPFETIGVPPREGITTGFAVSAGTALVAAAGRDLSFMHRGSAGKWDTPLTLGGPAFEDLAFADEQHATLVRGGPGQEFAQVLRSADGGLTWKPVGV
ncbi:YCF48-related protein [Lentzea fradiae]|uniref:YCF48-related protein n=1 Tax=Lentzea fradiae TaxID=200378 RepID=UPI000B7FAE34|nr:YCF48-related protein [Lentzea fradiae]